MQSKHAPQARGLCPGAIHFNTRLRREARRALAASAAVVALASASALAPPAFAASVDEVHYTFTSATSVTFDWRGTANTIRYGTTIAYGSRASAVTPTPLPFSSAGPFWEARLRRLAPATTYHYSIGGGSDERFHTPPAGRFRFDVMGDIGSSLTYPTIPSIDEQIAADRPSFVIGDGDLTYASDHGQPSVDQHFNDVMAWSRSAAYMPAWGNNEWTHPDADDLRNYTGRFDVPNGHASPGAPAAGCCGEDWGWFDAGGVRFISYPEPYVGAWADWATAAAPIFDDAQADPSIHFIVTFGHRPAYSTGHHVGDPALSSILDTFGDAYPKYVLNINAHSHDYERFEPIHGVTHVTASGGGASLEPPWSTTDSRTAYRAMHLATLRVDVTASSMHLEAVCGPPTTKDGMTCTQGTVIDSATIDAPDEPPSGSLAVTPTSGAAPLAITADASSFHDDDSTKLATYRFHFGDGSSTGATTRPTASHRYTSPGRYRVRVTVTDTAGLSSSDRRRVRVTAAAA